MAGREVYHVLLSDPCEIQVELPSRLRTGPDGHLYPRTFVMGCMLKQLDQTVDEIRLQVQVQLRSIRESGQSVMEEENEVTFLLSRGQGEWQCEALLLT